MAKIAALPMYDFPEIRENTNNLWCEIAAHLSNSGIDAPKQLTRPDDFMTVWLSADLILAQTCGLPFVQMLSKDTQIVCTPDYGINATKKGWYNSVLVVRADDYNKSLGEMRGACFAYNDIGSQSGLFAPMYLLLTLFGDAKFFHTCLPSGGHANSVEMVADGRADIAAIDAVSWQYIKKFQPTASKLRVLARTPETPGLPYICSRAQDVEKITGAVVKAISELASKDKSALGLCGFWRSKPCDYRIIAERATQVADIIKKHGLEG